MASLTNRPLEKDCTKITPPYAKLTQNLSFVQKNVLKGAPLNLSEKILYSHLNNPHEYDKGIFRGETYLKLNPGNFFSFFFFDDSISRDFINVIVY
jgi:hypothetical protein